MGLKLKHQIVWILFFPMSVVIMVISYFNISILENTLVLNINQVTSGMAEHLTGWVKKNIFMRREPNDTSFEINPDTKTALNNYLIGFDEIRSLKIFDLKGHCFFTYGDEKDIDVFHNPLFSEVERNHKGFSNLWAYKSEGDSQGVAINHTGFLDSRTLNYIYYEPLMTGDNLRGVLYISFYVKKLPKLLKLITLGNISLVFVFLISTFIAISIWSDNAIKRPLEFILQAQERLRKGDFDFRVNLDLVHSNELARTYGSFNKMAENLKSFREELEKKNKRLAELNMQYRQLNETLEQEVDVKTRELREFFSLLTHDLKVPLAAAQGYTDLLLKNKTGPLNDKQRKFLNSIYMANSYLLHLVRNMLDSVKYDAGKINYFFESFELPTLVIEVKSNLNLFLEEKQIEMEIVIPSECVNVYADRMKIGQVLLNLLSNAVGLSKENDIIKLIAIDKPGFVEIRITDTGPGIAKENISTIFEKFTQFAYGEESSGGMGLGLYIVSKILEGHSQEIVVESEPGKGTTFVFSLPKTDTISNNI